MSTTQCLTHHNDFDDVLSLGKSSASRRAKTLAAATYSQRNNIYQSKYHLGVEGSGGNRPSVENDGSVTTTASNKSSLSLSRNRVGTLNPLARRNSAHVAGMVEKYKGMSHDFDTIMALSTEDSGDSATVNGRKTTFKKRRASFNVFPGSSSLSAMTTVRSAATKQPYEFYAAPEVKKRDEERVNVPSQKSGSHNNLYVSPQTNQTGSTGVLSKISRKLWKLNRSTTKNDRMNDYIVEEEDEEAPMDTRGIAVRRWGSSIDNHTANRMYDVRRRHSDSLASISSHTRSTRSSINMQSLNMNRSSMFVVAPDHAPMDIDSMLETPDVRQASLRKTSVGEHDVDKVVRVGNTPQPNRLPQPTSLGNALQKWVSKDVGLNVKPPTVIIQDEDGLATKYYYPWTLDEGSALDLQNVLDYGEEVCMAMGTPANGVRPTSSIETLKVQSQLCDIDDLIGIEIAPPPTTPTKSTAQLNRRSSTPVFATVRALESSAIVVESGNKATLPKPISSRRSTQPLIPISKRGTIKIEASSLALLSDLTAPVDIDNYCQVGQDIGFLGISTMDMSNPTDEAVLSGIKNSKRRWSIGGAATAAEHWNAKEGYGDIFDLIELGESTRNVNVSSQKPNRPLPSRISSKMLKNRMWTSEGSVQQLKIPKDDVVADNSPSVTSKPELQGDFEVFTVIAPSRDDDTNRGKEPIVNIIQEIAEKPQDANVLLHHIDEAWNTALEKRRKFRASTTVRVAQVRELGVTSRNLNQPQETPTSSSCPNLANIMNSPVNRSGKLAQNDCDDISRPFPRDVEGILTCDTKKLPGPHRFSTTGGITSTNYIFPLGDDADLCDPILSTLLPMSSHVSLSSVGDIQDVLDLGRSTTNLFRLERMDSTTSNDIGDIIEVGKVMPSTRSSEVLAWLPTTETVDGIPVTFLDL